MNIFLFTIITLIFLKQKSNATGSLKKGRKLTIIKDIPPYPVLSKPVRYFVHSDLEPTTVEWILNDLSQSTCLQFKKQDTELDKIGINFYLSNDKDKVQLSSSINKPTRVYLTKNTFYTFRLLTYYIGSALGLIPEVSRHDRNKYIKIKWNNIDKSNQSYYKFSYIYKKRSVFNTAFDFGSAMLLGPFYGSKNNKYSFEAKLSPFYNKMIGKLKGFSYNDIKHLNKLYCGDLCKSKIKGCRNGGYPSKQCTVCQCPREFTGKRCEFLTPHEGECGKKRIFRASKKNQYIMGDKFDGLCYFSIYSKRGTAIEINLEKMTLHQATFCDGRYGVEIKHRYDKGATGFYFCGRHHNITVPGVFSHVVIRYNIPKANYNEVRLSFKEVKRNK